MNYKYFPHTQEDLKAMMEKAGVKDLDGLYAQIPDSIRFKGDYKLPSEMSEMEVRQLFEKLGSQNQQLTCFAGFGVYDHRSLYAIGGAQPVAAFRVSNLLHSVSG